jgi:hypothetical protein
MKRYLCSAAGAVALLAAVAMPSVGNASVISVVGYGGSTAPVGSGTQEVGAAFIGTSALTYADDYLTFTIAPSNEGGSVQVDDLVLGFAGEVWKLTGGPVSYGPLAANNVPVSVLLDTGYTYTLAFSSGVPTPGPLGISSYSLSLAPLPGALALFAGGLGLLGFAGLRKGRKGERPLTSVIGA